MPPIEAPSEDFLQNAVADSTLDTPTSHLRRHMFLSPDQCEQICEGVLTLRDHWIRRQDAFPFYTLGVPSYLDASHAAFEQYQLKARRTNPILLERFEELYNQLVAVLSELTHNRCFYDAALSYPGFHIFHGDGIAQTTASRHCDLQAENIRWDGYQVDLNRQISFTLVLRLPSSGSGLYVWNIDNRVLAGLGTDERRQYLHERSTPSYHRYEVGALVVHNGHYLHQIARIRNMHLGDQRITLQGHAVFTHRGWVLYW